MQRILGVLVATAVALVLSGCDGAGPKNADGDMTRTSVINGQNVRIDLPSGPALGLAVWFHGQGGDSDTRMNEDWLNEIRGQGWAVASSDFHGNAWGNGQVVTHTGELLEWAKAEAGNPELLMFVAGSMGALNSLTYMAGEGEDPHCWYGTMPVVDATKLDGVKDSKQQIDEAHDGAVPAPLALVTLPASKYRVLYSPADTMVPAEDHAVPLTDHLSSQGYNISSLAITGEHGDPSHFNGSDLAAFAGTCI